MYSKLQRSNIELGIFCSSCVGSQLQTHSTGGRSRARSRCRLDRMVFHYSCSEFKWAQLLDKQRSSKEIALSTDMCRFLSISLYKLSECSFHLNDLRFWSFWALAERALLSYVIFVLLLFHPIFYQYIGQWKVLNYMCSCACEQKITPPSSSPRQRVAAMEVIAIAYSVSEWIVRSTTNPGL